MSTDISFNFGDNENGIKFPQISICHFWFSKYNSFLKNCRGDELTFTLAVKNCLKNDSNFSIEDFTKNLFEIEKESVIENVQLWWGSGFTSLDHLSDELWSLLFNVADGPCFSFNLSKSKKYKFIPYKGKKL